MQSDLERRDSSVIVTDHDTIPDEFLHGLEVLDSGSDVAVLHIHFGSHLVGNTYMVKLTDRKIT